MLGGAKTKTPCDCFMSNEDNKSQLINLIFDQCNTNKYASKLFGQNIYFVIKDKCYHLTCEDGNEVQTCPHESLFSSQDEADTRIVLHCLEISKASAASSTIIVRSPDTDVLI